MNESTSKDTIECSVRLASKAERSDLQNVFRVYLPAATLQRLQLAAGDICNLEFDGQDLPAIAWPSSKEIKGSVVQVSEFLRQLYNLNLGNKINISRAGLIKNAQEITLSEVSDSDARSPLPKIEESEKAHWLWLLHEKLCSMQSIYPGLTLEKLKPGRQERSFKIHAVHGSAEVVIYSTQEHMTLRFKDDALDAVPQSGIPAGLLRLGNGSIGGLDVQMAKLNDVIKPYSKDKMNHRFNALHRPRRGGVILYGPSGTGKSMLLQMVSEAGWNRALDLRNSIGAQRVGGDEAEVRRAFADAYKHQPSVIIIDNLDVVAGKKDTFSDAWSPNFARSLCEEFDQRRDSQVLVIAATNNLAQIDKSLRRPGRFEIEIEIPVPSTQSRTEILKILYGLPRDCTNPQLEDLAERTHGYVGADLEDVIQIAMDKHMDRLEAESQKRKSRDNSPPATEDSEVSRCLTASDLDDALREVKPTAMKEVFLETPKTKWADIGGQHDVKRELKQAVEWPLKHRREMAKFGLRPCKGLLLYGPPGCSKTLTARAIASEMNVNFLAIKGAEILSMYVGESERALRDVFSKARTACPSVLFFDEIDAIGTSRDSSSHGGLNVLTTLLNELDGIEMLNGVFVLAATNQPWSLDPALLRPGRLDSTIYVGLPDIDSAREILDIQLRNTELDPTVNIAELAERAKGYSGAEIVQVCQKAGTAAMREQLDSGIEMCISARHFDVALESVPRQISTEMIDRYRKWAP